MEEEDKKIFEELQEIVNIDLLTQTQLEKARDISKRPISRGFGPLAAVKYISKTANLGLKFSKAYYDLYVDPERDALFL
jgi:hypothetical protein